MAFNQQSYDKLRTLKRRVILDIYAQMTGQDKCVKCGTVENLEWDHIDRATKSFKVSGGLSRKWSVLAPEVQKCQRLCKSCHVAKTKANKEFQKNKRKPVALKDWKCKVCGNVDYMLIKTTGRPYCPPCNRESSRQWRLRQKSR